MTERDSFYLAHIVEQGEAVGGYLQGVSRDDFYRDRMRRDAVLRAIQIIGEAAKRLSSELTTELSDIPWREIAGMRDKLVHDYFDVDIDLTWKTATRDVPQFTQKLRRILEDSVR